MEITAFQGQAGVRISPLALSPYQIEAIPCKDRVFAILRGENAPPSERAAVTSAPLCEIALHVDTLFRTSLEQYRELIENAISKDAKTLAVLEATPRVNLWKYLDDYVLNPVVKTAWSSWRDLTGYSAAIRREAGAFRLACLVEIGALEKKRISDMKVIIIEGAKPMVEGLKALITDSEIDVRLIQNLRQLAAVYKFEFGEDLVAGSVNIPHFLDEIKGVYPALI